MTTVTLHGTPFKISGDLPSKGSSAPEFSLCNTEMEDSSLGKVRDSRGCIISIYPSVDTPVCAKAARKFNEEAASRGVTVACVSKDLPMASKRFCAAEGIESVHMLSAFRDDDFGKQYGVEIVEGPLRGLFARALLAVNSSGEVVFSQLVPEIAEEPDYEGALNALENDS